MQESPRLKSRSLRAPLPLLLVTTALLVVGSVIFRNFLFGDSVLLYTDIGSDSLNFSYPQFVNFSDYIRHEGFPSWSFSVGMGRDIFYLMGFFLLHPVAWLPRHLIAHALIYEHLAKSLIVGLSFFYFLRLRKLKLPAALLGALLLAFSAYMCLGSCWHGLSDEVVCFSVLLLGTEIALQRGCWFILALAVGFVGLLGAFYLYLCALFLCFYVPARILAERTWRPGALWRTCLILAGAALLGVGLAAVFVGPNLYAILNSPRGSGITSVAPGLTAFPVFGFESSLHYVTAVLRVFATDMLGTGDGFRGWSNCLEAPLAYCGLICLVLLPQAFVGAPVRRRVIYALFFAAILVPIIFPWFRYLFWLFQGDYYRTLSFFSILGMLTLGMTALSGYAGGRRLSPWLLAATVTALLTLLYFPSMQWQALIDISLRQKAAIFLVLYGALLICGQLAHRQQLAAWCVVALAVVELTQFDWLTVSNRKMLSKTQLTERTGYNDETVEAVRYIKGADPEKFYRITKLYFSTPKPWQSLNDAMVFGYYGTSSYSSFNNLNYINFLSTVEAAPNSEIGTRWAVGLVGHAVLSIFACEKYLLTNDPEPIQIAAQYEAIHRYGNIYLFSNELFLPLGLTFTRYISEETFRLLAAPAKAEALLRAVVLSDKDEAIRQGLGEVTIPELEQEMTEMRLPELVAARRQSALTLTSFHQTQIEGIVRSEQKTILVLQTPFDQGWRAFQDGHRVPALKVDVGLLGMPVDSGEHSIRLRYSTPYLAPAFVISCVSFLLLVAGAWRWLRLHRST